MFTHADSEHARPSRLVNIPKVDSDACATLATKQLILVFGIELVPRHPFPRVAVPSDILTGHVF